jgi:hypothetical protein
MSLLMIISLPDIVQSHPFLAQPSPEGNVSAWFDSVLAMPALADAAVSAVPSLPVDE